MNCGLEKCADGSCTGEQEGCAWVSIRDMAEGMYSGALGLHANPTTSWSNLPPDAQAAIHFMYFTLAKILIATSGMVDAAFQARIASEAQDGDIPAYLVEEVMTFVLCMLDQQMESQLPPTEELWRYSPVAIRLTWDGTERQGLFGGVFEEAKGGDDTVISGMFEFRGQLQFTGPVRPDSWMVGKMHTVNLPWHEGYRLYGMVRVSGAESGIHGQPVLELGGNLSVVQA